MTPNNQVPEPMSPEAYVVEALAALGEDVDQEEIDVLVEAITPLPVLLWRS